MSPSGWTKSSISQILERVNNPVEVKLDCTYQEIGIRSHAKGIFHKDPVTGRSLGNKRVFHIVPNCFVVNIVFAWEHAIAKTTKNEVGLIASHRFPMYKPKGDLCDIDYILYLFKSKFGRYLLGLASPGGAGRNKTLGQAEFSKIEVVIPSIKEQKKIAKILLTWDKAIATTEQLVSNGRQQKKALMQQLLTGKKHFPGFCGRLNRCHISDFFKINTKSLGKKTPGDFEFDYISLSDVNVGRIATNVERYKYRDSPSRARRVVSEGDILFATVRPNLKSFAKVGRSNEGYVASTGFSVLTPNENIYGDYIYHYLFSAHITGQVSALVVGSNYPAINSSDVGGLLVYCPDFEEQKKVAQVLNVCDLSITTMQDKLNWLKKERNALMQQLLTGKRRVALN